MKEEVFIKQKELAIKMWTGIKDEISKHGKDFDWKCLEDYKQEFCDNEKLVWKYNCFLSMPYHRRHIFCFSFVVFSYKF